MDSVKSRQPSVVSLAPGPEGGRTGRGSQGPMNRLFNAKHDLSFDSNSERRAPASEDKETRC